VISRWSRAARVIGPKEPRESAARRLYKECVQTHSEHVIEQALELADSIANEKLAYTRASLPRDEYAESWCEQFLCTETSGPIVLMNPGAGWGAKQWPAARYGEVAKALAGMGYCVVVNTGPSEESMAKEVVRASGRTAMIAECNVSQLISLTRRVALTVAGDTGPLHLACALGKPVVGIFGPTDPARNGPYGSESRVLRSPLSKRDHSHKSAPEAGLLTITPEAVLGATVELLQNSSRTSA
jgi:heptosyltransferase-1